MRQIKSFKKRERRTESVHLSSQHSKMLTELHGGNSYTGDERQKCGSRKEAVSVSRLMQRLQAADKTVGE